MKVHKLGEVCIISKGESITRVTTTEGNVPVIAGGLGPAYFHNIPNRKPPVITISASGANAGFVNLWELPIWASDCTTITEKSDSPVLIGYIYRYLQSKQNFINIKLRRGSAQPHVYPSDIAEIEIPLPSIKRQSEIVEKLIKVFAEIDSLEENVAKSISLNDSLLRSKINSELGLIRKSVDNKILGDFGKINYGYTARSSSNYVGPKYLRITDIQDKFVDWAKVPRCEIASEEKSKFKLSQGDIVFARTGATTGKSFLIDSDVDAVFASYLIRIKPDTTKLDPEFLYYFFQSSYYWDQIADGISGSAQGGFNASKLYAIKVSFPSDLVVQKEVVRRIREFEVQLNLRTRKLLQEANSVRDLRQSLLSSAFIQEREVA